MKKLNFIKKPVLQACFLIFGFLIIAGFNPLQAKKLSAFLSYSTLYSPETGPYIETYLTVVGNSVEFIKNDNDKFQGSIQVILLFRKGEEIVNFDKYELFSPELDDTLNINFNFIDQQRYSLPNGNYEFEIQIWDKNNEEKPFINLQPLIIDFPDDKITISGIQLVESYSKAEEDGILSKSGYDLIPYIINYYPENVNKITFYAEIYNTEKVFGEGEKYLLSYYIETLEKGKPLPKYIKYKKETAATVNILFSEFDITNLQSGNYFLTIEARDKQNNLLGLNKIFIQRSNPRIKLKLDGIAQVNIENSFVGNMTNTDSLKEFIRYLEPISTAQEKNFANVHLASSDLKTLQKFFYKFWLERNELEPERAWLSYLNEVNKVNFAYTTLIMKGYETDRGMVYLKYGPPNAISESYNEPAAYPYEIWHYYELENGQRNKKFVFFTQDLVTNNFTLLHSDVTGELSNYRWQYILFRRVNPGFDIDQEIVPESWGDNSRKYFDLPR